MDKGSISRIEIIPQETADLAVHVALCAQRHRETVDKLNLAQVQLAELRRDLRRLGLWVVAASASASGLPWVAQALPLLRRLLGDG